MTQHFLLSAAARSLSLRTVARMTDEEAHAAFVSIRWSDNGGEPYCPRCGCVAVYKRKAQNKWKCKACEHEFTATSGTIFASRKLPIRDYLLAIAIFANGAKGHSALQLSRDMDVQYKTAFVMAHKMREAMASQATQAVAGSVEIDGAYFGGYVKPANHKANRVDRRLAMNATGKRKVVVVLRERDGEAITLVAKSETASVTEITQHVEAGSTIYADEAKGWNSLDIDFPMRRINHSECYADDIANTNQAESFFSRLRRAEIGIHHHISGYLSAYAGEMTWRENNRRISNGDQCRAIVGAALRHPPSLQWKGYWQRAWHKPAVQIS
jgi:transposase-like protein